HNAKLGGDHAMTTNPTDIPKPAAPTCCAECCFAPAGDACTATNATTPPTTPAGPKTTTEDGPTTTPDTPRPSTSAKPPSSTPCPPSSPTGCSAGNAAPFSPPIWPPWITGKHKRVTPSANACTDDSPTSPAAKTRSCAKPKTATPTTR